MCREVEKRRRRLAALLIGLTAAISSRPFLLVFPHNLFKVGYTSARGCHLRHFQKANAVKVSSHLDFESFFRLCLFL